MHASVPPPTVCVATHQPMTKPLNWLAATFFASVLGLATCCGGISQASDPATLDASDLTRLIDHEIQAKLDSAGLPTSPLADDAEFLRRIYLDLNGVIPSADEVVAFLRSRDPQKRAKRIDELLKNPKYGEHMGGIWGRMLVLDREFDRPTKPLFFAWLAEQFHQNRPWDEFVFEILTAEGESAYQNPAVAFLADELRTISPALATDLITSRFLGLSIECAQCHQHPFADWSQEDYWGVANFYTRFTRTKTKGVQSRFQGLMISAKRNRASQKTLDIAPKFLDGDTPMLDDQTDRRVVFARWATASTNPFFARAKVNRLWAHFFGRGFVNPVDDMALDRQASHPRLMETLTEQFVRSGFDIQFLVRAICNSQTYQRTSKITKDNGDDQTLFSHMPVKMMTPEQLWCSYEALGLGLSAVRSPNHHANLNLELFRSLLLNGDEEVNALEYKQGATHALFFMNDLHLASRQKALVERLTKSAKTPAETIDRLYLTILSRYPTEEQKKTVETFLRSEAPRPAMDIYGDILWALLLSSEFTVNH